MLTMMNITCRPAWPSRFTGFGVAEDGAEEHGEQQHVADDADGPRPDLAPHAAERAEQAEDVAEHLPPQQIDLAADMDLARRTASARCPRCGAFGAPREFPAPLIRIATATRRRSAGGSRLVRLPQMLLQAALNGRRTRSDHEAVPISPAELQADAIACGDAGAHAFHVHPRDARGVEGSTRSGSTPPRTPCTT